jgi:hypothetical protein
VSVVVLQPGADEQTKGLLIQALLPTILQLENGKAIELVLPALGGSEKEPEGKDKEVS